MSHKKNYFPLLMKTVAAASALLTVLLAVWNCLSPRGWLLSIAIATGTTCYHFSMRLLVGAMIPHFPIRENARWFQPRPFEEKLHAALRVKRWKRNMPTYSPESFSPKHNSLAQIIRNSCYAELVHEGIILFSFVPLLFALFWGAFPVFLITSLLAALYDSFFVIMQRYNRPRLVRILNKKEAKSHE